MNNTFFIENEDTQINNTNNIETKTVLGHYSHQVGGHSTILSVEGKILKPLINREFQFYQYISNFKIFHNFLISPFIPRFFGNLGILNSGSNEQDSDSTFNNNINNVNTNKMKIKSSNKHPVGTKKQYIMLEDITVNYKKPCIVDIKIGTRQRGVVCSSTTSTSLGVRICGMKLYKENFGYIVFDRYIGRSLTPDTLENLMLNFFTISSQRTQDQINLLNSIIEKLNGIKSILSNEKDQFPFKIYSSSLLIVYEGNQNNNHFGFDDISYVNSNNSSSSSLFSTSAESNSSVLSNSSSNYDNYNEQQKTNTSPILNGVDEDASMDLKFKSNSRNSVSSNGSSNPFSSSGLDALTEILSTLSAGCGYSISSSSVSSSSSSFSSSSFNSEFDVSSSISTSGESSRCSSPDITCSEDNPPFIKNDVKMIDFAHAIPFSDIQESSEDDGYAFGIQNLINILSNIKCKFIQQSSNTKPCTPVIDEHKVIKNDNNIAITSHSIPIPIPQI